MLPFTLLALLAPLIRADSSIIIPSRTSIVRDLFPPYAAGPATYYASVAAVNSQGTVYAITCLKPTTFPTPDPQSRDPCLTSSLGDSSQTFTQGKDTWMVTRSATPSPTDGPFFTECAMKTASSLTEQDEGVLSCFVRRSLDGFGPETRGGDGNSIFGMQRQAVTITGGFELLGDAGATAEPTSGAGECICV